MTPTQPDTEDLLRKADDGDRAARDRLLQRHRGRLSKMVALRLDRRLAARVDASDVVQEVLAEADRKLERYLRERPLPFYPWLRQLAAEHLLVLHRRHVKAARRSVRREQPDVVGLPDESAVRLAELLVTSATGPTQRVLRAEMCARVRAALSRLAEADREVLTLRHLEELSVADTAAVLDLTPAAVKMRQLRALTKLRALLDDNGGEVRS
jgi:RNA polymerase sigma-70 factor (ECF subfamily)